MTPPQARRAWYRGIVREFGKRGAVAHWHENRHDLLTGTPELALLYRQYLAAIDAGLKDDLYLLLERRGGAG